ncbi:SsgA family sporulation/cell division regulator [Nonomuraea sp. NPDC050790]|uniref:SsgA family sporulation/cell division regulator n=1 Tax=Nonomuraea sp. NPDC050790 TaxID=3364371 RepID=UPI00378DDD93
MSSGIVRCVTLRGTAESEDVLTAFLSYLGRDPHFVRIEIPGVPGHLDVARFVLAKGLNRSVRSQDFRIAPSDDPDVLFIGIPADPALTFLVARQALGAFLAETYVLVPAGQENERIDWDGEYDLLIERTESP